MRIYETPPFPVNQIFRGRQRSLDETEFVTYVVFEGESAVSWTSLRPLMCFGPKSYRIQPV